MTGPTILPEEAGASAIARIEAALTETEARLAAQSAALEMSEALGVAMTASALDCVIMIDETGCVIEFNPAAELTFGHRRADVLGRPIGDIIVPEHLRQRHAAGFARYIATGAAHVLGRRIEIEGLRANGAIFPLELTITDVSLPARRLFTAYLRDLTDAKAAAAEILRSREALHQSEKMAAFGSLLAGVAHELNNPLSIVIGNALMLTEDAAGALPQLAARAGKIQQAAERCGRIVRTFLSMARQRPIALRPFPLARLVNESVELLAYNLRSGGVDVEIAIADDLPQAVGDSDQLIQVVVNLLVNAQQALQQQPLPRRIRVTAAEAAGVLVLAITDNGPGVPADIRSRIFDPFFTTKPMGVGTGIGLAVSRGIVEAHGGTLALDVPAEGGARFEVRLKAEHRDRAAEDAVPLVALSAPLDRGDGAGCHSALIVDDEPEVAAVLVEMIASEGYRSEIAEAGADALARLARQDFDAILCDIHMPDLDGPGLFGWIEANRPQLAGRVVFITADTLGSTASTFLARSLRPVLEKPFVPDEVRRVMAAFKGPKSAIWTEFEP